MGKKGFYFDQTMCSGCRTCMTACRVDHNLPTGKFFRRVTTMETGSWPDAHTFHVSIACNHCENPACVAVCPVGAMYIDEEDGTVQHNDDICLGCQYCVMACPYGEPQFNEPLGIVQKCDGCKSLREQGEEPICVAACTMRALKFGDLDELRAKYGDAVSELPCIGSADNTNPSLLINPKDAAKESDYVVKKI